MSSDKQSFENLSKEELLKIIQENKKIIQDQKHLIAEQISTIDNQQMIIQRNDQLLDSLNQTISVKQAELAKKDAELSEKDAELSEKDAELSEKDTELSEKDTELSEKDTELSEKKLELAEKESELAEKESEIAEFKAKFEHIDKVNREIINPILNETLDTVSFIANQLGYNIFSKEDILSRDFTEQFQFITEELCKWVNLARSWFYVTPFASSGRDMSNSTSKAASQDTQKPESTESSNDSSSQDAESDVAKKCEQSTAEVEKKQNELLKASASLKNNQRNLSRLNNSLTKSLNHIDDANLTDELRKLRDLNKIPAPPVKAKSKKKSKGRVAINRKINSRIRANNNADTCSKCGGKLIDFCELRENLISSVNKSQELLKVTENIHDVKICNHCGQVDIAISDRQNVPVVPNREITCEACIQIADGAYKGFPLNKITEAFRKFMNTGNNTLYYSMHDFVEIYIDPLYQRIMEHAQKADTLIVDGTPFPVLAAQGKMIDSTVKDKLEKGQEHTPHSTNYVLSMTSTVYAQEQFVCYGFSESRSAEEIRKVITKDFCFKNLQSDAYAVYPGIASEHNATWATCLIHWRRELIKASLSEKVKNELQGLSDEELLSKFETELKNGSVPLTFVIVIDAIGKIFAYEEPVSQPGEKFRQLRMKQRQTVITEIMDRIDEIMQSVSKDRVILKGNTYCASKSDPYAKACVYYMNNRDGLRAFLFNPDIEPSSNTVERTIRNLAIFKKNVFWLGSYNGVNDMNKIYSVFATAKANDIDIVEFLREYCHSLYKYCIEKKWTEEIKNGKNPEKKIIDWDMKELSKGFDFNEWDLVTYNK